MANNGDQFDDLKLEENDHPKPSDHISYPKIDPKDITPPPPSPPTLNVMGSDSQPNSDTPKTKSASSTPKSVTWSAELTRKAPPSVSQDYDAADAATTMPRESNRYISAPSPSAPPAPSSTSSSVKDKMNLAKEVLGRWGKKVGETTKKAEGIAGNVWQHLKTGPSFADAAMGRIAHGTKVLAEGGYEKIFRQTFEAVPGEQLQRSYACYLSTSAGPVMGTLYLSTEKLAFCSDNALSYTAGEQTEWSYYKVVIPLHQLKSINPSISKVNRAEKYIQVISVDDHEFWFMGFVNYDGAVMFIQEASESRNLQSG